jgi:hypothetical protein
LLDPSLKSIDNSEFYFHEVNEGQFGIRVDNPSASTYFEHNFIRTVHDHATSQVAVQLGQNQTNASNIRLNTLEVRTAAALYPSHAALQVWGDYNAIDLIAVGAVSTYGAKFEPGSNNNVLFYGTLNASTPIANFGVNNTFMPKGSGSAALLAGAAAFTDVTDDSPTPARAVDPVGRSGGNDELLLVAVFDRWAATDSDRAIDAATSHDFGLQSDSPPDADALDWLLALDDLSLWSLK